MITLNHILNQHATTTSHIHIICVHTMDAYHNHIPQGHTAYTHVMHNIQSTPTQICDITHDQPTRISHIQ